MLLTLLGLSAFSLMAFTSPATTNSLPPRPTLTPTIAVSVTVEPVVTPQPTTIATGAAIVLMGQVEMAGWATAVEWQDGEGNWHVVEGWQAPINEHGQLAWAVAEANYGQGPFRWVVASPTGLVMDSAPFLLPDTNGEQVLVWVR